MPSAHKILIIEDNRSVLLVLRHIAQKQGFTVDTAASLAETKERIQSCQNYLVASVDHNLPDAPDGEAIDYVQSQNIPVIVFTGNLDLSLRETLLKRPIVDYIVKDSAQAYDYLGNLLMRLVKNQQLRVLIVDDSSTARNQLKTLLSRHNFLLSEASNGREALDALNQYDDISLIITDNDMPGMDGLTLVNEIRRQKSRNEIAIIGMSASQNPTLTARFIKNGANDFLIKPFCHEELFCRININIEHIENIQAVQKAANTDFLTNMFNRRYFFEHAKDFIEQGRSLGCQMVMLDIDYFKQINDKYGHEAGDAALIDISKLITRHFADALNARLGGEEFALLIAGNSLESTKAKLETFRQAVEASVTTWHNHRFTFTVSIGVIDYQGNGVNEALNQADELLYQAKETGRNKIIAG